MRSSSAASGSVSACSKCRSASVRIHQRVIRGEEVLAQADVTAAFSVSTLLGGVLALTTGRMLDRIKKAFARATAPGEAAPSHSQGPVSEWAASRGMTDSQFNLGMLYARGLGVKQDLAASRATAATEPSLPRRRWSAMEAAVSARFVPVSPSGTGKTLMRFSSARCACT